MFNVFQIEAVRFSYGPHAVPNQQGWTFDVPQGSRIAILGRSGSGKTTLLHTLGLLAKPHHGSVSYAAPGEEAVPYAALYQNGRSRLNSLRRQRFGFVFQDDHLLENLSTLHNLMLPLTLRGVDPAEGRQKAEQIALRLFQKPSERDRILRSNPSDLSGGQRSRIALLRGMVHDPEVLFLDEPFTYLDNFQARRSIEFLHHWQASHPAGLVPTIVLVTHDLMCAAQFASHFLVMAPENNDVLFRSAAQIRSEGRGADAWLHKVLPDE